MILYKISKFQIFLKKKKILKVMRIPMNKSKNLQKENST